MSTRNGALKTFANGIPKENQRQRRNLLNPFRFVPVNGQRRLYLGIVLTFTFLTLFYTNMKYYQNRTTDYRLLYSQLIHDHDGKPENHCHLPQLDPFDQSIREFLTTPEPLQCKKIQAELSFLTDDDRLAINGTAVESEHYATSIDCKYRCFDKSIGLDDVTMEYGDWKEIKSNQTVKFAPNACPFIDVSCSRSLPFSMPVYSNTHSRIVVDDEILRKSDSLRSKSGRSWRPFSSVLLFILDSVSHSNFIRSLPKTLTVLKNLYNVTVFDGYTKIGDNSLPNAVAFLTGKRVSRAGYESDLDDDMSKKFYDDWPFVWKRFAQRGYVTMYAEDYPNYNLFQYMSNGFKRRPVDHYFRPFWVHTWGTFLHMRSTHLCYGNTPKHRLQLDYLERILKRHRDRPLFAFNWLTELGHDWMNQIKIGDDDLAEFFARVRPYLNDTSVVVLSDHGHRFDPIRQTVIGRIEERMPFLAVSLPSTWTTNPTLFQQLQKNLARNSKLLTSPFDLHATLLNFLSLSVGEDVKNAVNASRGSSLFESLPSSRNCFDADVPEEYCVCQKEVHVANASNDEKVSRAVAVVIAHLNDLLSPVIDRCFALRLSRILHAQTFLPNLNAIEDDKVSIIYGGRRPTGFYVNYRVAFVTVPGDAMFESAVRYSLMADAFNVIGDVNRINKYGNQSDCIKSVLLRKYCFCKNITETA